MRTLSIDEEEHDLIRHATYIINESIIRAKMVTVMKALFAWLVRSMYIRYEC